MAGVSLTTVLQQLRQIVDGCSAASSDGSLLARFVRDHDQSAFRELLQRHGPMVLGLCRRLVRDDHLAEDLFQATFLVLARKAGRLEQWGSLANWLYTVAYRLALKSLAHQRRRQDREEQVSDMTQVATATPEGWNELRPVLDAELNRLSSKHRAPVVLCYLEGKTNEQAARELGLPVGTVKTRLAQARELLRARLERRGLALALLSATGAWAEAASAAVPSSLLEATVNTAQLFAQGQVNSAGAVAPRPTQIAQGAVHDMYMNKVRVVVASLLLVGVAGGAGVLYSSGSSKAEREAQPVAVLEGRDQAAQAPEAKEAKDDSRARFRKSVQALDKELDEFHLEDNTLLVDALGIFSEKMGVPIVINKQAFNEINVSNVEDTPVNLPKIKNARLSDLLQRVLDQVGSEYTGTFIIRPDRIEVTTTYHQTVEALGHDPRFIPFDNGNGFGGVLPPAGASGPNLASYLHELGRRRTPVIQADFDKRPLAEVLQKLAAQTRVNIAIDPRAKEALQQPVSLNLQNALLDTSVTLLTEMCDLDWVWIDKVIFVTTRENARARREREKAARPVAVPFGQAPGMFDAPARDPNGVSLIDVAVDQQPLGQALQDLAQAQSVNLVIDARVREKTKAAVSLNLRQVKVDSAIRLLADMAGLGVARVEGVFYVTSKENARTLPDAPSVEPLPPARTPALPPPPNAPMAPGA